MKEQDIIKACAELDGYTINGPSDDPAVVEGWCWDGKGNNCWLEELEYTSSYNAIIPLIQKQDSRILREVGHRLLKDCCGNFGEIAMQGIQRTPAQLCEALLRATGKWKV